MSGGPRRFRGRGRGAAGQGEQADPAAGAYDEWTSAADDGWDLGHGGQQQQGGSTSSYFGTNDAAGVTAPAADGPQASAGKPVPATGTTAAMPTGYGDPNANMSPMHMWFGPPASTWSHYGSPGLLGTVPPGPLPQHAAPPQEVPMMPQGTVPAHGGLPHQAFGGCGMPYGPYGQPMFHGAPQQMPLRPGLPHQAPLSSASVLPPQAPMSSAYNVYGPCADLPHGPQPHQVPHAAFQQAPNGTTGCGMTANGFGSGGATPQAGTLPQHGRAQQSNHGSPDRFGLHGGLPGHADPWSQYKPSETVANAKEFSQRLREERPGFKPVT